MFRSHARKSLVTVFKNLKWAKLGTCSLWATAEKHSERRWIIWTERFSSLMGKRSWVLEAGLPCRCYWCDCYSLECSKCQWLTDVSGRFAGESRCWSELCGFEVSGVRFCFFFLVVVVVCLGFLYLELICSSSTGWVQCLWSEENWLANSCFCQNARTQLQLEETFGICGSPER